MKKITLTLIAISLLLISNTIVAQNENNLKNFRFGIYGQPSIDWYKPNITANLQSNGSKMNFAYGLMTEFRLNKIACLSTGIEASYSGGKLGVLKDIVMYSNDTFMLSSRNYRVSYVTIPLTLKMKTNEIGAVTYFGQFGADLSFKTSGVSKVDDGNSVKYDSTIKPLGYSLSPMSNNNVDISKDMAFLNVGLNIGLGFEYNLVGTTSAVISVNYHNGFTNVFRSTSKELRKATYDPTTKTFDLSDYKPNASSKYVSLTLGILF